MFNNVNDFNEFKTICRKENIPHLHEKTTIVVLKGLIRLLVTRICQNIEGQDKTSFVHRNADTKYPIYQLTFAPGTSLVQINHIRYIEHVKIYWEKYETPKPTFQCFRCQARGHICKL